MPSHNKLPVFTTIAAHMPAAHRAHMDWTPQRLIHWGQSIGPATAEAVTRLMAENKHPEHGYRSCLGLLSLAKRYGKTRLEAGSMLALQIGACQYRHVLDILKNNRDQSAPATAGDWVSPDRAQTLPIRAIRVGNNRVLNWDRRDEALASELQKLLLEMTITNPNSRITLGRICQNIPQLKAKLSALDRLPLTRQILKSAIRTRRPGQNSEELF